MLPKSLASFFIALILKVESPLELGNFRPIFILCFLYKSVAKVLAARIVGFIKNLISKEKSTFIRGKEGLLVDGVVSLTEILDLARVSKRECFVFKVAFEKAYDLVSWSFLDYMLWRFSFGDK